MKSMNRMKVIRRITTLVMLFIIIFCFAVTGFDMNVIINRGSQAVLFIKRMFPPDTGYCGKVIEPLIKTVQMSIAGTPSFHAKKLRSLFRMRITFSFFPIRQALRPYPPNNLHPRSTG